ncbi:unnamed protein product [Oikopleura dioica]|uniref:Uncharacterized protein n=1 Tax=Oikopleura dioica TaxID=34765 RepID=E4XYZ9_OIKDI|nr:unnamed protein product [Oikopleura dioica]CBY40635.1 unnamed protein product [Oikopleura dioica]
MQLQNDDSDSDSSSEILFFRQKYFPDVSLLSAKEKELLLRQIEQDFRLGRNGAQTIPENFFNDFAAKVESAHKISIALAYLSKLPQFGQYRVRLAATFPATNSTTPAENNAQASD